MLNQQRRDLHNGLLTVGADIVDLIDGAVGHYQMGGAGHVLGPYEITPSLSLAVDRQRFAFAQKFDEFRNQFLGILIRTIDIITADYYDRKTETVIIRANNELGSGLGCSIRIGRIQQ